MITALLLQVHVAVLCRGRGRLWRVVRQCGHYRIVIEDLGLLLRATAAAMI